MSNPNAQDSMMLDRHLQEFRAQIGLSQKLLKQAPVPYRELLMEAFSNVDLSIEELQVADHELRTQYSALEDSRQTIEYERERYRRLFQFAPDGYLVTDAAGTIREANRAASVLLNIEPRFLLQKPLAAYISPEYRNAFRRELNTLQDMELMPELQVVLRPRKGEPFTAALTASAERDSSEK